VRRCGRDHIGPEAGFHPDNMSAEEIKFFQAAPGALRSAPPCVNLSPSTLQAVSSLHVAAHSLPASSQALCCADTRCTVLICGRGGCRHELHLRVCDCPRRPAHKDEFSKTGHCEGVQPADVAAQRLVEVVARVQLGGKGVLFLSSPSKKGHGGLAQLDPFRPCVQHPPRHGGHTLLAAHA